MITGREIWNRNKSRLIKLGIVFAAFLLFVIFMDKVVMPFYVHLGQEIEMPDIVEKSIGEAQSELEKQDFTVIITDSIYDSNYPIGTVVEQMPFPFSTVKKGRNVYLKVSIGEKPIIMPNLFYISPRDAELTLKSYGLKLGSKYLSFSDISPKGVVIAQSYPQGQKIKKGSKINITVSLGPRPKQKTIPDLIGESLEAAKSQLRILGVAIDKIEYKENDNVLPETVLKQNLTPGIPVKEETKIELLVSKIKQIENE